MPDSGLPSVTLFNSKSSSVYRRHPWVFSGAIKHLPDEVRSGSLAYVRDEKGNRLGFGLCQQGSIAIKILHFGAEDYAEDFWPDALRKALELRQRLGMTGNPSCTAYRLVHGEGDGLPGLVIDIYGSLAILQFHSIGMGLHAETIVSALRQLYGVGLTHIYNKSNDTLPPEDGVPREGFLLGDEGETEISENGIRFRINAITGQKTGFFLDQRDNRRLLQSYAGGRTMLNAFCYTGGFSMYALSAGARMVTSMDSSAKAMSQLELNLSLNGFDPGRHESVCGDVIPFLNNMEADRYDLMVLDPPAFAKSLNKRHNAVQAYKRINAAAIKKIRSGGLLFTFSCSQVIDEPLFNNTIVAAGIEAGRSARVIHRLSQAPDHPVSLFHPEGHYLKGLVLEIG